MVWDSWQTLLEAASDTAKWQPQGQSYLQLWLNV